MTTQDVCCPTAAAMHSTALSDTPPTHNGAKYFMNYPPEKQPIYHIVQKMNQLYLLTNLQKNICSKILKHLKKSIYKWNIIAKIGYFLNRIIRVLLKLFSLLE